MKTRAFTLVEVLVSLALITIALLGVMGSIAYGTKSSTSGHLVSEASHLGRSILTIIQEESLLDTVQAALNEWPDEDSGLNDTVGTTRLLNEPPFGNSPFEIRQLELYRRRIQSQRVNDDITNYRYRLAKVKVTIFWSSKQGDKSVDVTGLVSIVRGLQEVDSGP